MVKVVKGTTGSLRLLMCAVAGVGVNMKSSSKKIVR